MDSKKCNTIHVKRGVLVNDAAKPTNESDERKAFWDVTVYAEHTYVRANRVDVRFVDHRQSKSG